MEQVLFLLLRPSKVIFLQIGMDRKILFVIMTLVSLLWPYYKRKLAIRSCPEENYPQRKKNLRSKLLSGV